VLNNTVWGDIDRVNWGTRMDKIQLQTSQPGLEQRPAVWSGARCFWHDLQQQLSIALTLMPRGCVGLVNEYLDDELPQWLPLRPSGAAWVPDSDRQQPAKDGWLKIMLLGSVQTGKSIAVSRFTTRARPAAQSEPTFCLSVSTSYVSLGASGVRHRLTIWELAGSGTYDNIVRVYAQGVGGILLFFDVADTDSFAAARDDWMQSSAAAAVGRAVPVVLVGSHVGNGRPRAVTPDQAAAVAQQRGWDYCEVDALNDRNAASVDAVFLAVAYRADLASLHATNL